MSKSRRPIIPVVRCNKQKSAAIRANKPDTQTIYVFYYFLHTHLNIYTPLIYVEVIDRYEQKAEKRKYVVVMYKDPKQLEKELVEGISKSSVYMVTVARKEFRPRPLDP